MGEEAVDLAERLRSVRVLDRLKPLGRAAVRPADRAAASWPNGSGWRPPDDGGAGAPTRPPRAARRCPRRTARSRSPRRHRRRHRRHRAAGGLPTGDAEIVKFTNNAVVRLPRAGAVLRIAGSEEVRGRGPGRARHGPLAGGARAARRPAAARRAAAASRPPGTSSRCGGPSSRGRSRRAHAASRPILRWWHAIDVPPPAELPAWNLSRSSGEAREAVGVADDDLAFLRGELAGSRASSPGCRTSNRSCRPASSMVTRSSGMSSRSPAGPVICDFDGVSIGPREWDLVPVAVGALRFDYAAGLHEAVRPDLRRRRHRLGGVPGAARAPRAPARDQRAPDARGQPGAAAPVAGPARLAPPAATTPSAGRRTPAPPLSR